jgi:DNA polymerase-3 subunit delta'
MFKIFPWQTSIWEFLLERYQKDRLPHAFLFTGTKGIGKSHFARTFAELLLCQRKDLKEACGHCRSCELLKTSLHPDLTYVEGEGKSVTIKIDQIRELTADIVKTAHFNGYRIVMIEAAHTMNQAASNALLKTLEEPPARVVFILLTDSPSRISATIRSRCEIVTFPKPHFAKVKAWLEENLATKPSQHHSSEFLFKLAQENPLAAKALVENDDLMWRETIIADLSGVVLGKINSLGLSEKYKTLELNRLLFWLKTVTSDLIRLKSNAAVRMMHSDKLSLLDPIAARLNIADLYAYLDKLYFLDSQVEQGMNLNHGLVVDTVYCALFTSGEN